MWHYLIVMGGKDNFLYYTTRQNQEKLLISIGNQYRMVHFPFDTSMGIR
jgi:hypothetical protein